MLTVAGFPVVIAVLVAGAVVLFRRGWTRPSRLRSILIKALVFAFSCLAILAVLDVVFYAFVARSDGFGFTLSGQRWRARHWKPVNAGGFRDIEHPRLGDRKLLLVVGDSFAAGYGVEDWRDRFSSVLADRLGPGWSVRTMARDGWGTVEEHDAIRACRHDPDVIVWSYFVNDIEGAAGRAGWDRPALVPEPGPLIRPIVSRSHFLNFVYWRVHRAWFSGQMKETYLDGHLAGAFADEAVWAAHAEELRSFVDLARARGSALVVVVFPFLGDVETSRPMTDRVVALLRAADVDVIDLAPDLAGRPVSELVVSPIDSHPGVALHREVGDLLYEHALGDDGDVGP